jgi:thiosulfate/3-mercaptopyruvate sulfurtransferase
MTPHSCIVVLISPCPSAVYSRYMTPRNPLVSTDWLQEKLGTGDSIVVLEVSSRRSLPETSIDRHVPGARFVYWKDLCWDDSDRQFPSPEQMAGRLSALGVADDTTIAVIGDPFQYGTYAYWVLTMAGQESRTVLVDGGRATWIAEGHDLGMAASDVAKGDLTPGELDESSRMGRNQVLERLNDPEVCLLDVRSAEEYKGERVSPSWFEVDHGAERHGRIPGAVHLHYANLLRDDGTFLDPDSLQAQFDEVTAPTTEVVCYCRLSHRATLAWFALTRILHYPAVRIYDGSWTEWGTIVGYPIER